MMRVGKLAMPAPAALPAGDAVWMATEPLIGAGRKLMLGLAVVALLASFISISGAVVTSGTVSVESSYKTLQHLDGGLVAKILVKNGDRVREGDVLVRLDDTQLKSQLGVARGRFADAAIQRARLEAERDGKSAFVPPVALGAELADHAVMRMLEAQRTLLSARHISKMGEQNVLHQRVQQLKQDLAGAEYGLQARARELDITSRELKGVLPLFEKGFINQQRLGPLQRDAARLEGEVGRLTGDLAKVKAGLLESEFRLAQSEKEFQSQVADELRKVESIANEAQENMRAINDKIARTEIRAPRAGRVHALVPTTEGGVITPASVIGQVIPEDEKLIIEVRITPQDIDKVRGGLGASVKFPAFNAKSTPRLEGIVTTVSPAQLTDQNAPPQTRSYFLAQIELPPSELDRLGREHKLVPGMPAEVYIETTPRSIMSYLVKPLFDSMSAFGR
jgi:HlyD family type I secretion membrane fusion protein